MVSLLYDKKINNSQYEKNIWLPRQAYHSLRIFKPANIPPTFQYYSYEIETLHLLPLWNPTIHLLALWIYSFLVCYLLLLQDTFNLFKPYFLLKHTQIMTFNQNKKMLFVVRIGMICSNLPSIWKFQSFLRLLYNPIKHLWWSFYYKYSNPLSIFTKKLHHRCLLGF